MRMFALIAATLALLAAMPASADPVSPAAAVGAPNGRRTSGAAKPHGSESWGSSERLKTIVK